MLTALGVALALVGVEVFLRVTDQTPVVTWGWRDTQWPAERNQLGFRGQRIEYEDDDLVVLLVGDSQVQADACGSDVMPERRLQHHLAARLPRPVKVFSLGCIGYGQDQQLLGLEEYLVRYRADAVVAWFTDANDTWNNTSAIHTGWPKPTFWLDEGGQVQGPTGRTGEALYSSVRILALLDRGLHGALDDAWERRLPPPYVPMTTFDGPTVADWKVLKAPPAAADIAKERTGLALAMEPPSARNAYAIALTNALLERMQARARAHGARFTAFVVQRPDFPLADGVYAFAGIDGQRRYLRLSRARHWQGVDAALAGVDRLTLAVDVDPFCSDTDPHFNAAAVDHLMRDLAAALASRLKD